MRVKKHSLKHLVLNVVNRYNVLISIKSQEIIMGFAPTQIH
jgi:hypothetical protein